MQQGSRCLPPARSAVVEFRPAEWIRFRYLEPVRDLADGGSRNTIAGQTTHDSETALMLARCLAMEQRTNPGAALHGARTGGTPAERLEHILRCVKTLHFFEPEG